MHKYYFLFLFFLREGEGAGKLKIVLETIPNLIFPPIFQMKIFNLNILVNINIGSAYKLWSKKLSNLASASSEQS